MMTAMKLDGRSSETTMQKQRYSRELAAYTFQQWDTARQALEQSRAQHTEKSSSRRSSPVPRANGKPVRATSGILSVDYARKSHKPTEGTGTEGRVVKPNML
ncbi:unnamed protein product [Somion occarium]|uniref:Uncharacterized protein n=1 Tax=Somion occarium TaxID=3059160 RepID=A0ABP1CP43_9APHY